MTQPELEVVDVQAGDSFKVWSHGYPFRTVKWHFHPEYEIHLITATSGRLFVGDYIGPFQPGNLVMTGPNLPHNWLSELPPGVTVAERCLVLQFSANFAQRCAEAFPEMSRLTQLLDGATQGMQFSAKAGAAAEPIMRGLLTARGPGRLAAFFELSDVLCRCPDTRMLASAGYRPMPAMYMQQPLNHVLAHIARNLSSQLWESELADLSGYSPTAFSRAFSRHTGMTFVYYVNGMRIKRACELLITTQLRITDICYEVGFNNLSNFNRQFLAHKAMSPRAFRAYHLAHDPSGRRSVERRQGEPEIHAEGSCS